jgi:CRP-like cAMP-binding protein
VPEIDRFIRKLKSIGNLPHQDEERLLRLPLRVTDVRKGTVVAADGEKSSQTVLLLQGIMHREKFSLDGARQILSLHVPGDIPDIQSLHLPKMDHNLVATTDAKVAFIDHRDLNALIEGSANLVSLLWRDTLIDAAGFRTWILMLGQADALTRMAHLFCDIYVRLRLVGLTEGKRFSLPLTQMELADAVGMSPVHANRTLQELRARDLIDLDRGFVEIHDWQGLRSAAMFDPAYLHYLHEEDGD